MNVTAHAERAGRRHGNRNCTRLTIGMGVRDHGGSPGVLNHRSKIIREIPAYRPDPHGPTVAH